MAIANYEQLNIFLKERFRVGGLDPPLSVSKTEAFPIWLHPNRLNCKRVISAVRYNYNTKFESKIKKLN
jgi:hypothetical protein